MMPIPRGVRALSIRLYRLENPGRREETRGSNLEVLMALGRPFAVLVSAQDTMGLYERLERRQARA